MSHRILPVSQIKPQLSDFSHLRIQAGLLFFLPEPRFLRVAHELDGKTSRQVKKGNGVDSARTPVLRGGVWRSDNAPPHPPPAVEIWSFLRIISLRLLEKFQNKRGEERSRGVSGIEMTPCCPPNVRALWVSETKTEPFQFGLSLL